MITFIKNNPIKFVLAGLLSLVLALNYFGFCYREARFLSDKEKVEITVKYILYAQAAINKRNDLGELIPYRDVGEFFSLNPECCQVTTDYQPIGLEGDNTSLCGRLTGFKSSIVGIRYIARYRSKNGAVQTKLADVFPGISNCGELVWDLG